MSKVFLAEAALTWMMEVLGTFATQVKAKGAVEATGKDGQVTTLEKDQVYAGIDNQPAPPRVYWYAKKRPKGPRSWNPESLYSSVRERRNAKVTTP